MEDKCFCHLNGYRVKDAEARNKIENLEEAVGLIQGEGLSAYATKDDVVEAIQFIQEKGTGYHVLELPLGAPVTEIPFGEVQFDLSSECLPLLEEFINKCYKSGLNKPILKVVNSSYSNGEYPMPLEITYINSSTEIVETQPTFLLFGFTLQLENMLWRSKLTINGEWYSDGDVKHYTCTSASINLYEEVENTGNVVDLSNYAKFEDVENICNELINGIEIPESSNYPIYYITTSIQLVNSDNQTVNDTDGSLKNQFQNMINDCMEKGYKVPLVILKDGKHMYFMKLIQNNLNSVGFSTLYKNYNFSSVLGVEDGGSLNGYTRIIHLMLRVNLTWDNNVCTVSSIGQSYSKSYLLTLPQNSDFLPTEQYHPATKKYVDQEINAAPTTTTGTFTETNGTAGASGTWKCYQTGKMCVLNVECVVPANTDLGAYFTSSISSGHVISTPFVSAGSNITISASSTGYEVSVINESSIDMTFRGQLIYYID